MPDPTMFPSTDYWSALAVLPPAPILVWSEVQGSTFVEWNDGSKEQVIIHIDHATGVIGATWDDWKTGEEIEWEGNAKSAASFRTALIALWSHVTHDHTEQPNPDNLPAATA